MKKINKILRQKFLWWPLFIIYFFFLKSALGLSYPLIYVFLFALLLLRISFERIATIFLTLSFITYIVGVNVEAVHYMSFVYIFLVLSIIKHSYQLLRVK